MNVYTQENPGEWNVWAKKPSNKNLPLLEAKSKYLAEQLLFEEQFNNFASAVVAANTTGAGGVTFNGISNIDFISSPVFLSQTGNTQQLEVGFKLPVVVTGTPTITVDNSQVGGGTAATFDYSYESGTGTKSLIFNHIHPASPDNDEGASANVLFNTTSIAVTTQPLNPVGGVYTPAYTSTGNGTGADFDVVVLGNPFLIFKITSKTAGSGYKPGDIITFADDALGAGSTGGTFTVQSSDLIGDVISIPSGIISLNGGTITTGNNGEFNTQINDTVRRQGINPPLTHNAGLNIKNVVAG